MIDSISERLGFTRNEIIKILAEEEIETTNQDKSSQLTITQQD
jgi:hypothetical protein